MARLIEIKWQIADNQKNNDKQISKTKKNIILKMLSYGWQYGMETIKITTTNDTN